MLFPQQCKCMRLSFVVVESFIGEMMSWTLSIYSHKVTCVRRILDLIQTVFNIFYISSWASSSPFWVNFPVTIFLVSFSDYKSRLHILLLFNFLHTHIYIYLILKLNFRIKILKQCQMMNLLLPHSPSSNIPKFHILELKLNFFLN